MVRVKVVDVCCYVFLFLLWNGLNLKQHGGGGVDGGVGTWFKAKCLLSDLAVLRLFTTYWIKDMVKKYKLTENTHTHTHTHNVHVHSLLMSIEYVSPHLLLFCDILTSNVTNLKFSQLLILSLVHCIRLLKTKTKERERERERERRKKKGSHSYQYTCTQDHQLLP